MGTLILINGKPTLRITPRTRFVRREDGCYNVLEPGDLNLTDSELLMVQRHLAESDTKEVTQ